MDNVIRKAVELAEGWRLSDDNQPLIYLIDEIESDEMSFMSWSYPQWMLDALAAQLVRQVDAINEFTCVCAQEKLTFVYGTGYWKAEGPDRTMNTLKAIVESKVLEDGDE